MRVSEEYYQLRKNLNEKSVTGEIRDEENPLFLFSTTSSGLLKMIVNGELDVLQLAAMELESRRIKSA
ncbi:MAG: hypothetical protein Kow0098_03490 [Ignavibacteriaceae bacterium]